MSTVRRHDPNRTSVRSGATLVQLWDQGTPKRTDAEMRAVRRREYRPEWDHSLSPSNPRHVDNTGTSGALAHLRRGAATQAVVLPPPAVVPPVEEVPPVELDPDVVDPEVDFVPESALCWLTSIT